MQNSVFLSISLTASPPGILSRPLPHAKTITSPQEMGRWVKEGKIHYREQVTDGLENAPQTFIGLLTGKNFGKVVIRLAEE